MTDIQNMIFYSQSSVVADWNCPRAGYYGHHYQGTGLSSGVKGIELFIGTALHDGLAALANGVEIDAIAEAAVEQVKQGLLNATEGEVASEEFASEQGALVEGLLRGFNKHVWPRILKDYVVHTVEQPCIYRHDDTGWGASAGRFGFMARPDLILEDHEGSLTYYEFKSTSSNREQWTNSWASAVQLHSGVRAFEQTTGEKITSIIVQGLYKGSLYKGKQTSPFCYGYHKSGEPPFTTEKWSYTYKPGMYKNPIWHRAGGVKAWVEEMPDDMLTEQFPQTPPIFINESLMDTFFRQQASRQLEAWMGAQGMMNTTLDAGAKQMVMDLAFPQRFDKCNPSFGRPCEFRQLCHGKVDNPLAVGFVLRDTSHRDAFKDLVAG